MFEMMLIRFGILDSGSGLWSAHLLLIFKF